VSLGDKFEQKSIVSAISERDVAEFGTVRPRVQIPGPRPISELRISESDGSQAVTGSQGGHRFSWNLVTAAPSKWIADLRLNSLMALTKPIYQHAHGTRTVRHLGSKIKGAVHAGLLPKNRTVRHPGRLPLSAEPRHCAALLFMPNWQGCALTTRLSARGPASRRERPMNGGVERLGRPRREVSERLF
jgi:hypothetical protein